MGMRIQTKLARARCYLALGLVAFGWYLAMGLVAFGLTVVSRPSTPLKAADEKLTFVLHRDVANNVYHTVVWHLSLLRRAALKYNCSTDGASLILLDGKGLGPFIELYDLLGFEPVRIVDAEFLSYPCEVEVEQLRNLSTPERVGTCIYLPTSFAEISTTHSKPWSNTYLRYHAPEAFYIRAALQEKYCPGVEPVRNSLVYVSRNRGSRGITNEQAFLGLLRSSGKTIQTAYLETLSVPEQVKLFCGAEMVIGIHGAAFTWTLAASTNAVLFEMFTFGWADPCYRNLAHVAGVTYYGFQNFDEERHDESKYVGRHGYTDIDLDKWHPLFLSAVLATKNSGSLFSPRCADIHLLPTALEHDFPCKFIYHRLSGEKQSVEHRMANESDARRISNALAMPQRKLKLPMDHSGPATSA